ncbi:MAG: protein adenylyltransferase SelO family protein, partial [Gammaproteobacteria bacterium]
GTFEFLAARGERDAIAQLIDAVIDRLYPDAAQRDAPVMALFEMIAAAQAKLVAQWMALGFVHGVMNTDNTALSGQTIDYGPCAFLDEFHRDKVFSSIDRYGRYAYSQQPLIATWNLSRLGGCLMLVHDDQAGYESVLENFESVYLQHYHQQMAAKLGLDALDADDIAWLDEWLDHLQTTQSDYTIRFREFAGLVESPAPTDPLLTRWHQRVLRDGRSATDVACLLRARNPAVIPRNHQIQRAIVAADEGDFSLFHTLREVFGQPFDLTPEHAEFALPPTPEQRVTKTFCGT